VDSVERQHTPGTWEIRRPAHITWNGPSGAFEIRAGDKVICQRPWAEGAAEAIREFEANALLIAAAPELLEACAAAMEFMVKGRERGYVHVPDDDYLAAVPGTLRAAIAKATGQTQNAPACG